jgi:hypothetical protein
MLADRSAISIANSETGQGAASPRDHDRPRTGDQRPTDRLALGRVTQPAAGPMRDRRLAEGQAGNKNTSVRVRTGSPLCRLAFLQVDADRRGRSKAF